MLSSDELCSRLYLPLSSILLLLVSFRLYVVF